MRHRFGASTALITLALLAGCGGGGGTNSTPAPTPSPTPLATPTPTPAPTPTPTPAAVFDTTEYRQSDGPSFHNAITAWQRGATGQGVTIGIVDSGIDTTNPEFAGRISAASADVAGSRGIQAEDDHGTLVALVAAAARNNSGVMGIAYQATIMALRADTPGTCADTANDGCTFSQTAMAAGIDRAVQNGAKVINLSLGGSGPGLTLRAAIGRAATADVVVVIAAGNDADGKNPSADPSSPDGLASGLRAAGNGNVIIAGSVDQSGTISSFTNRAGTEANWYLTALGEGICCVYENGVIKTSTTNGQTFVTVVSGTSFSTPQIAGAVALLRQAFPNLTAAQTVDLLLRTARDAGATGIDPTYGRGILDIANAFAPQGTTAIAGTSTVLALTDSTGSLSPAMGDAAQSASLGTIVLDSYGRAYGVQLAGSLRSARPQPKLGGMLMTRSHEVSAGSPDLTLAFSVAGDGRAVLPMSLRLSREDADSARVLAGRVIAQLTPDMRLGFAFAENSDGIAAALRGSNRPAFLVAGSPLNDTGFTREAPLSIGLRRQLGPWGLTVSAEHGRVRDDTQRLPGQNMRDRPDLGATDRFGLQLDRRLGNLSLALGASWLHERDTVLGARFNPALVPNGANSLFLDLDAAWQLDDRWQLGATVRRAWTRPGSGGLLADGSRLVSQGWAVDVTHLGIVQPQDSLALRVAQPLRVENGGFVFDMPTSYSYALLAAENSQQRLSLVPRGREIVGEMAWRGALWGGSASASIYFRKQPGNYAAQPTETGIGLLWTGAF
ncbi:MAG TPA: S8 family peptidase [Novosphingobium sp.]